MTFSGPLVFPPSGVHPGLKHTLQPWEPDGREAIFDPPIHPKLFPPLEMGSLAKWQSRELSQPLVAVLERKPRFGAAMLSREASPAFYLMAPVLIPLEM